MWSTGNKRMQIDLSNQVIARIDDESRQLPRRTLDLGNIFTPELGLLSPQRNEIAPRGGGRDNALIAYAERLRDNYKINKGGIRDGMLKLGEAFREGQTIAVSCFCRAGEICHADVVKKAIEKVGHAIIARESVASKPKEIVQETPTTNYANPRTQRAINDMLSAGRSDLILSKLDDTEGRNRSEHASYLNRHSQFTRDLYERGAVVRDGLLISPKENPSPSAPLAISTIEYAVKRLEPMVGGSKAKELAPQIVAYGAKIAGSSADRDTQIKVFNWIYGALEGRNELLEANEKAAEGETKQERFDRTLNKIASLAEDMSRLEPSDRLVSMEHMTEKEDADRTFNDELSLENVYEDAIVREEHAQSTETEPTLAGGIQEFERVELEDMTLSRLAADRSRDELDRWINVRLPVLDEMLESGTPVDTILKPFQNSIYETAKNDPTNKQAAIDDLRFASAYVEHQLKQPESRLRHFNARYRIYASMLERAATRDEVIEAASRIRLENAKLGFQWNSLPDTEKRATPRPLTPKEMQFLLTEASPRHYTTEMTAARLAYSNAGDAARTKTDALVRGEITPSREATQLIESLESRLERKYLKDSLSATKHFLQSLKAPNEELRYKNAFDHAEVYRKLPPAERDFVYQRAASQKELLESRVTSTEMGSQMQDRESVRGADLSEKIKTIRESLKSDLVELVSGNPGISGRELNDRTTMILEKNLENLGSNVVSDVTVRSWSRELGAGVSKRLQEEGISRTVRGNEHDRESPDRGAVKTRPPASPAHER